MNKRSKGIALAVITAVMWGIDGDFRERSLEIPVFQY